MTQKTFEAVIARMASQHVPATFEHPGYIAVRLPNGTMMNCGEANANIACDITNREGHVENSTQSDIPSNTEDANVVGDWIAAQRDAAVDSIMEDGASRWQCPKCGSLNLRVIVEIWANLIQPSDGCWETDIDDGDHEWNENSGMTCRQCGHSTNASEFEVSAEIT